MFHDSPRGAATTLEERSPRRRKKARTGAGKAAAAAAAAPPAAASLDGWLLRKAGAGGEGSASGKAGTALSSSAASVTTTAFRTRPLTDVVGGPRMTVDPEVHGQIHLEPALLAIVDTPYFQRLEDVHQLGFTRTVYRGANHTRFEHSLGVAHLAERQVEVLRRKQGGALGITAKDVLLVKMAGLCHDMGHGPFSHCFEVFGGPGAMEHEEVSLLMLDAALRSRGLAADPDPAGLDQPLRQVGDGIRAATYGLEGPSLAAAAAGSAADRVITTRDLCFVKECILGRPLRGNDDYVGRPWSKEFLYDVVNNRYSGKDVDKDDYFARDAHRTIGGGKIDQTLIEEACVAAIPCAVRDCFRCRARRDSRGGGRGDGNLLAPGTHLSLVWPMRKCVDSAMNFFKRRKVLHSKVYTHKGTKALEYLVLDALEAAEPHFRLVLPDGRRVGLRDAPSDPDAYALLTDDILGMIENTDDEGLEEARRLLRRKRNRDIYKMVDGSSQRINERKHGEIWRMGGDEIKREMMEVIEHEGYRWGAGTSGLVVDHDDKGDGDDDEEATVAADAYDEQSGLVVIDDQGEEFMATQDDEDEDDGRDGAGSAPPPPSVGDLLERDFIVEMRVIHHGRKEMNPVSSCHFLLKSDLDLIQRCEPQDLPLARQVNEDEYECDIPKKFMEKTVRVYSRASALDADRAEKHAAIRECFELWLESKGLNTRTTPSLSQC
jgi:HD superfamily phosphohydrolase